MCKITSDIITLDCDGVIFNSNYLKIDAFRNTFSVYTKSQVEKFFAYFKDNFGTSRYGLIKHFIFNILQIPLEYKMYQDLFNIYGANCIELYAKAPFTESLIEFLSFYKNKKLYVASGSDEKELQLVFKKRQLNEYFQGVYGSPRSKTNLVKEILYMNEACSALFIGDAFSDFKASCDNNIQFNFMKNYSTAVDKMLELARKHKFKVINHLGGLIG